MRTKNSENATAPTMAIAALAPVKERLRKMRIGSSGERERSSITTNATIRAAEVAKSASVEGAPQPFVAARVVA